MEACFSELKKDPMLQLCPHQSYVFLTLFMGAPILCTKNLGLVQNFAHFAGQVP